MSRSEMIDEAVRRMRMTPAEAAWVLHACHGHYAFTAHHFAGIRTHFRAIEREQSNQRREA